MSELRPIKPLTLPGIVPAKVDGTRPALRWISPTALYVDETYQRDLSRKSISLIRSMIANFAWNRMKPPIVVDDAGKYHVVDGQHTAIAAATIGIPELPVFVVEAATLDERARSFVGHNTDRIMVSPINIYHALRAAGDPDALDVANVCARAGVRIREFSQSSAIEIGDTKAVGLIRRLIAKRGVIKTRQVLECLVKAKRAPLTGGEIIAAAYIVCDVAGVTLAQLTAAIRVEGDDGLAKARARASKDRSPLWRAIADRWMNRIRRT